MSLLAGSADGACNAGYTGADGASCQACPAGTYLPFSGWLVAACTSSLDADPVLTDASLAVGRVVCCRGEYDATRKDSSGACLGGQVSKTFWEAKTI